MSRTIEVEDDVFFYLWGRCSDSGKSFSEVIRAGFGLDMVNGNAMKTQGQPMPMEASSSEIEQLTKTARFLRERTALGRFLVLLSHLYKRHTDEFDSVTQLHGRRRQYLGRSKQELENSGTSVYPKQIPGSPYWVVTNLENPRKRAIIESVMRMMGYGGADIRIASSAI